MNKFLLLDTNILIRSKQHANHGFFEAFFLEAKKLNTTLFIDEATRFEFIRGSRTKSHRDDKETYLKTLLKSKDEKRKIDEMILPLSKAILKNAEELGNLYSNKNSNLSQQISITDCLIAAQLMEYGNQSILATLDNNDFPLFIFDRVDIFTIDTKKEILNIGFYQFNERKYKSCKTAFKKAK